MYCNVKPPLKIRSINRESLTISTNSDIPHSSKKTDESNLCSVATKPIAPPIWFLGLCTASAVIGLTILTPALPLIKNELAVSGKAVQQLLTVFLIALAIGQLVCGPLSDRVGRRPVLLVGALLFSVAGCLAMFTQSIELLIALRFVQGLGASACMSMGRTIVNDVYARDDAARQMSTISTVLAIAPALSLAFGGVLAEYAGWKGTMAILVVAGTTVFYSALKLLVETNLNLLPSLNFKTVFKAYATLVSNTQFVAWAMAGGMQIGIFFSLNAFLAYQYQRNGYSMAEFGFWFALTPVSYILGNALNRFWFVSRGIELAAFVGCMVSMVGIVALYITQAMGLAHALSLAIPCCIFGFGNGMVVANTTIGAITAAGKFAGTGSGVVGAWQMATGGIAGAIIIALGGDQIFSIAAGALIVMSIIAVASMVYIRRHRLI